MTPLTEGSVLIRFRSATPATPAMALFAALLAGSLTACGGGATPAPMSPAAAAVDAAAVDAPAVDASAAAPDGEIAADLIQGEALPTFHMAPAVLAEPADIDAGGTNASARVEPLRFDVDASLAGVDTARLTPQALAQHVADVRTRAASVSPSAEGTTAPAVTTLPGAVFSPAQIRAAYGLPALPATGSSISASVAATLGAGQTIYLIDAYHDAGALADLNRFSAKFGLPSCTGITVATTATLPLAKPGASCTFATVHSTSAGALTATTPAYNGGWAPESKLDVQWAHAIAPLARIVLVETPDAMSNNLLGGIALANRMGPGVVSMSFGMAEASWAPTVESRFTTAGMTYVAATGDSGAQVDWPAVSPHVLAVGGTGLQWSGSGARVELAWSHTGGGVSAFEALPSWQSGVTVAGGGSLARRAVPDVSFNANPMTGQYVAVTPPGSTTTSWGSFGGTSIAAPQWAGLVAVANAIRVANSKALLGDIHSTIYSSIARVPGTYAAAFSDIVQGSNGTCSTCFAGNGYDALTGWGTPDTAGLLSSLTGSTTTAPSSTNHAPTIASRTISTSSGRSFSTNLTGSDADGNAITYTMTGAPTGMSLSTTGTLAWWTNPKHGTYAIHVTVTDTHGAKGTGTITLVVA
jgi:subtilase family serine protease